MSKTRIRQIILLFVTIPLLAGAMFFAYSVYQDSIKRSQIKDDYGDLNSINYGILSVNVWKDAVTSIVTNQIEEFELTKDQDSLLQVQLTDIIRNLVDKADSAVRANDQGVKGTLRKWAVHTFVNTDKIKSEAPEFSRAIIHEVMKDKNKERMKKLAVSKLNEFAKQTYDPNDSLKIEAIYSKYDVALGDDINTVLLSKANKLENKNYREAFFILGIVGIYLLLWFFVFKYNDLRKVMFFMSVALAITVLLVGLTSAMIEIDARISKIDFVLLGQHIKFTDQVIFYRSKSILQLVHILLSTGKVDSIFVGILVLAFSILLPITKLISTEVYLFGKEKWRSNKVLHWLAFKSGKWSMADVMVVAIFMAYVGFNGILDDQMEILDVHSDSLTSVGTNHTSLQPGYILFITFVIFGLILSAILKRIIKMQARRGAKERALESM